MTRLTSFLCLTLLAFQCQASGLSVSNAWIRLLPAGIPAAGYFTLHNDGTTTLRLVGAASTAFAQVMMHRTIEANGQSRMEMVDAVPVPAGGEVAFSPAGYHLMLMQPTRKIALGERVPIRLRLSDGTTLSVDFLVRGPDGK